MKLTQFFPLLLGAAVTMNAATLSSKLRTDGTELRAAFGEAAGEVAKACTVNIYAGSKFTGLGTVVSSDGIVVAKNSEIDVADPGTLRIVGPGKRIGRTRILARDIAHDLVFLDLGREVDPGYEWGDITALNHGTWGCRRGRFVLRPQRPGRRVQRHNTRN